ncbi:hypothetical protein ILUMI_05970 [Ignelater luminosus]|uniref:Acyltransferase 3 domain-containing protein n=1 Tax=Ignelater luminosus TaxID=2038154 RepID=A0A8K0D6B8_IGNLU|nr:hypothetical protein ILUMI_05970 [Ignelater luminosus]
MYGFTYLLLVLSPLINWLDVFDWITDKNKASVLEAIICGDTFFVISGLLISYNYLVSKEKGIKFNIFLYYLMRIIRLTPALVMAVLVHATLLRHMGSGPVWPNIRDSWLVDNCRENWWPALLYVQNYVTYDIRNVCILQTWQLSVDMQLYLLSPLILLPLDKAPKFTISAVIFLLVCSVLSPFLTAWVYELKAVIASSTSLMDLLKYTEYYYFPTHTRASTWLIGFLMGYIMYQSRKPNARLLIKKET